MNKRQYKFSHLQPEQAISSKHIEIEDSYTVDEELISGTGEQVEQIAQENNIQMAHNETERECESKENIVGYQRWTEQHC